MFDHMIADKHMGHGSMATKRMVDEAQNLGADAVINIRYGSSTVNTIHGILSSWVSWK